ncbi:hypothetical protein [Bifidobacterium tsurumiense]|uniref:Putative CRISPR-associated Csb3 family protein n=1 Tax=Bifidobacterium tsurumiense TaxID=356829 RepID=A0A087EKJ8_9BIFI|nr:hypothetical protein [Bifidobacterium tsurumiense]KFJ08299.1 putative CRISPR-associated Csb3 family protein [Bifidobacterium tsurumiense]MDY4678198.1 hypothetical protein [Bifidobacterium tsurumiense]
MEELTLSVDVMDAFDHFFVAGLAAILEDEYSTPCSWKWDDFQTVTIAMSGLDDMRAAQAVSRHVQRWAESEWLQSSGDYTITSPHPENSKSSSIHATMSPRLSGLTEPYGWQRLQADRHKAIDALQTSGDRRYIGALGEPSYWSGRRNASSLDADMGASRWEMVARNRGQEFIGGRLLPLAQAVSQRDIDKLRTGLLGETIDDEVGKNQSDSRSATGLHRPQVTDNARVWCALMGVSAFPHMVTTAGFTRDATAGLTQLRGLKRFSVLPVSDQFWTLAKYRSITRSAALLSSGVELVQRGELGDAPADPSLLSQDGTVPGFDWLKEKGVVACALFRQFVSDNASAPERWIERGHLVPVV